MTQTLEQRIKELERENAALKGELVQELQEVEPGVFEATVYGLKGFVRFGFAGGFTIPYSFDALWVPDNVLDACKDEVERRMKNAQR